MTMTKPSPVQARLLRFLDRNKALVFLRDNKPPYKAFFDILGHHRETEKYQPSTIFSCRRLGWLETLPIEEALKADSYFKPDKEGHSVLRISAAGSSSLTALVDSDFITPPRVGPSDSEKTSKILGALYRKHPMGGKSNGYPPKWIALAEVNVATGFAPQRIDFWAFNCWPSQMESIGYEIKVSRGDWRKELANPEKRRQAMEMCDTFYFVVPKGLIKQSELPEGCGLYEWSGQKLLLNHPAPRRNIGHPTWYFLGSVARHALQMGLKKQEPA